MDKWMGMFAAGLRIPYGGLDRFLPHFCIFVFQDGNKKEERHDNYLCITLFPWILAPTEPPKKRSKASGQCLQKFELRQTVTRDSRFVLLLLYSVIAISPVDQVSKSISSNSQKGIPSVRDGLFLSMVRL